MVDTAEEDAIDSAALGGVAPNSIDGALVRSRLMASMFGAEVPAPRFGRFELRDRIGQGGMGVVYCAWDPQLEREVAIKLVDTTGLDSRGRELALEEARSLAKLSHPNVITVFEVGLADDRVWIAMELVPGATMGDWLARTPRPGNEAILRQWIAVGRGLISVHEAGLIHRDVKPSNVLVGDDDRPRLIDFGLVRKHQERLEKRVTSPHRQAEPGEGSTRSHSGRFAGTHAYAAPEQLEGREVGAAADQYALCVSIWESLCERRPPPPHERDGGGSLVATPEGVKLPARVHRALSRGLAADPRARFDSVVELLAELEAVVGGRPRRLGLALGAGVLGAVLAGIGVAQLREGAEPCAVDPGVLEGTWDDAQRARLRERLLVSELDFAETTFATLERGLDDWATGWLEARRTACAATRIEGVQSEAALDLRHACLERKRRAVQVTLGVFSSTDEGDELRLAAHAPELLASLPRVGDCADPERLAEIEPLPEPGPQRDAIVHGYDVLSEVRTLAAAGAFDRAEARVAEFEAEYPDARSHVPLRLELDAFPGQLLVKRQRTGPGVTVLVAVAREAAARRLDELAATLLTEAAEQAAGRWSKPELERSLLDEATAALRRLDQSPGPRTVALQAAKAALLEDEGRYDDSLALHEQAQALARELGDEARAEALYLNIAAGLALLGRFDEARDTLEAGHEAARQRWGLDAPAVGFYEFDAALLAMDTGDFETASTRLDRAEAIYRTAFGADSIDVARVRFARAKLHMVGGELRAALALIDDALETYVRRLGPDHGLLAELHEGRGVVLFFTGDLPGSIASYEAALRIKKGAFGPEHPDLARLHSNIGESQAALGKPDEARASFERALVLYARTLPADHPELALPLKGRGQAALASGQAALAVGDLERALELQLAKGGEPLEIADLRISLARALAASGQAPERATALALRAREDFERLGMDERVAKIDAWSGG